jgi:hypothetical protein
LFFFFRSTAPHTMHVQGSSSSRRVCSEVLPQAVQCAIVLSLGLRGASTFVSPCLLLSKKIYVDTFEKHYIKVPKGGCHGKI